jgi:hypothetical protein
MVSPTDTVLDTGQLWIDPLDHNPPTDDLNVEARLRQSGGRQHDRLISGSGRAALPPISWVRRTAGQRIDRDPIDRLGAPPSR